MLRTLTCVWLAVFLLPVSGTCSPDSLSLVVASHLYPLLFQGNDRQISRFLEEVEACNPQAIVLNGDIIPGTWDLKNWKIGSIRGKEPIEASLNAQWDRVDSIFASIGVPVWVNPGNHDITSYTLENREHVRAVFESRHGQPYGMKELAGHPLFFLNTIESKPDFDWFGLIGPQAGWFKARMTDLKADSALGLVFMHHPLWYGGLEDSPGNVPFGKHPDWMKEIHPFMKGKPVAVFAGDGGFKKNYYFRETRDGIPYHINGAGSKGLSFLHLTIIDNQLAVYPHYLDISVARPYVFPDVMTRLKTMLSQNSFWVGLVLGLALMGGIWILFRRKNAS